MNKFEKQLEKWNHGVLRGAQAKLAKALKVSTATTALWTTGRRHPSKGYIAQMANLFQLDTYQVLKLFNTATTYPLPANMSSLALRESKAVPYLAPKQNPLQQNTVQLPFLARVPLTFPHYPEEDVLEWWGVPRRYAQGTKYIVRSRDIGLPGAKNEQDLCFIKPAKTATEGQLVLLTDKQGALCVAKACLQKEKITYISVNKPLTKLSPQCKLIAILVRRVQPL